MKRKTAVLLIVILLALAMPAVAQSSPDPGKPDVVSMDSLQIKPGEKFVMSVKLMADDTTLQNEKQWVGVGSFCIPIKYDVHAIKVDSIKFVGTIDEWDERFTNQKIDTGFISLGGIHNIAGKENPVFHSPGAPQEIARIFGHVNEKAAGGSYSFELTTDPIQGEPYLGSIDGVNGWKFKFIPGKVAVK